MATAKNMQQCAVCKKTYPKTSQYFRHGLGDIHQKVGVCHLCNNVLEEKGQTVCTVCGVIKTFDEGGMSCGKCYGCLADIYPPINPKVVSKKGTVYFILSEELQRIKIGVTVGDINLRLKALQGSCPTPIKCIGTIESNSANHVESNLHKVFDHLRLWGEWFTYTDEIANYIYDNASSLTHTRVMVTGSYAEDVIKRQKGNVEVAHSFVSAVSLLSTLVKRTQVKPTLTILSQPRKLKEVV